MVILVKELNYDGNPEGMKTIIPNDINNKRD